MDAHVVVIVLGVLLAISEGLALVPGIASNSVFQLVINILKSLKGVVKE